MKRSGKGLRIVEGLWKDCGGVVALCSLYYYEPAFRLRANGHRRGGMGRGGGSDVGREGRGEVTT
jgi:hypothetical protein